MKSLICTAAAVFVLAASVFYINSLKSEYTFELVTKSGDKSALNGLEIEGRLQDTSHATTFKIADGKLKKRLVIYNSPSDAVYRYASTFDSIYEGNRLRLRWGVEYVVPNNEELYTTVREVKPYENPYQPPYANNYRGEKPDSFESYEETVRMTTMYPEVKISITEYENNYITRGNFEQRSSMTINIEKPMVFESKSVHYIPIGQSNWPVNKSGVSSFGSSYSISHANMISGSRLPITGNAAVAYIGDEIFFTYPSLNNFSGMNGIYKIDKFGGWSEPGSASLIAPLDVRDGAICVIGLHAVGENLILTSLDDKVFTLRAYSRTGELLSTLSAPEFYTETGPKIQYVFSPETGTYVSSLSTELRLPYYTPFISGDSISLLMSIPEQYKTLITILSVRVGGSEGLSVIGLLSEYPSDYAYVPNEGTNPDFHSIAGVGDKIAVVVSHNSNNRTGTDYVLVFGGAGGASQTKTAELLYCGELRNNRNDDVNALEMKRQSLYGGGYLSDAIRYLSDITIKGGGGH